jgi:hypothetical protein
MLHMSLADIETLFDLVPGRLNRTWSYGYDGSRDPEIQNLSTLHSVPDVAPPQKKTIEVRFGHMGGQKIGPTLPIQALGTSCNDWSPKKNISTSLVTHHHLSMSKTYVLSPNFKT